MKKFAFGPVLFVIAACAAQISLGCAADLSTGEDDVGVGSDRATGLVEATGEAQSAISRSDIINRALQWYNVQMPYCGGVNGGPDYICGGTCWRTGAADNPAWNPYRSDCSGFVSWAWGLPAPGYVTSTLPNVATVINVADLQPGDMLDSVSGGHVVIFEFWVDKNAGKAHVIHEPDCGQVATGADVSVSLSGTSTSFWGMTFTAYRYNNTTG